VHVVGFIVRIYHDARSPERQICELVHLLAFNIWIYHGAPSPERQICELVQLVDFIIRIYHDARSPEWYKEVLNKATDKKMQLPRLAYYHKHFLVTVSG